MLSRVRHLARGLDCKYIILDHLSIVVSALEEDGDERKLIDRTMTLLRTLVQETGIALIIVSHLKRPEGKGHEEGARTSLAQLRGSHAIAQLSDIVIGLERNQQDATQSVGKLFPEWAEEIWADTKNHKGAVNNTKHLVSLIGYHVLVSDVTRQVIKDITKKMKTEGNNGRGKGNKQSTVNR